MGLRTLWLIVSLVLACVQQPEDPGCIEDCGDAEDGGTSGASESTSDASLDGTTVETPGETLGESTPCRDTDTASSGVPPCTEPGDPCTEDAECCMPSVHGNVCVAEDDGGRCRPVCADDSECASGCCARLHGGGRACLDAEMCESACAPLLASCEGDDDCCDGTSCTAGRCTVPCTKAAECPSGCCGDDGQCTDAAACGGTDVCIDGSHVCPLGTVNFRCDDDAWYAVDCDAACIDAGFPGSSGCAWSDIYMDAVCLCETP